MPASSRLIPANEYRRERWKNGLGWTREILRLADERGMTVYLGTAAEDGWWKWDEAYLAKALERRKELTRKVAGRYGELPVATRMYCALTTRSGQPERRTIRVCGSRKLASPQMCSTLWR